MIRNFEELAAKQSACATELAAKFQGTGGKRAIVMCGGTGCLSSNSQEIMNKHARPPYPSPTPGVYPNSCPLSW